MRHLVNAYEVEEGAV